MRRALAVLLLVLACGCSGYRARLANDRGKACAAKKNVRCSITEYSRAVALQPNDPKYRYNLGLALGRAGYLEQAATEFEAVLRLDPADIDARRMLGRVQAALRP